jgi:hypothetical protein
MGPNIQTTSFPLGAQSLWPKETTASIVSNAVVAPIGSARAYPIDGHLSDAATLERRRLRSGISLTDLLLPTSSSGGLLASSHPNDALENCGLQLNKRSTRRGLDLAVYEVDTSEVSAWKRENVRTAPAMPSFSAITASTRLAV